MISASSTLLSALSSLRDVQRQVNQTLREIDPNSTEPTDVKARQDARMIQVQASQKAGEIAGVLRRSAIDLEA